MASDVEPDCRFCLDNGLLDDEPLFGNGTCYFLTSADPVLQRGGMIIPHRHVTTPFELTEAEWSDTFALLAQAKTHLEAHKPDGYTLGWNSVEWVARRWIMPICTSSPALPTSRWPVRGCDIT